MKVIVKCVHVLDNKRYNRNKSYRRYIVAEYWYDNIDDIVRCNHYGGEIVKLMSKGIAVDVFTAGECEITTI